MDITKFLQILTTFADSPADLNLSKGRLVVQVREDVIEATLAVKGGNLYITEDGQTLSASTWLINRIARLPLLADRILSHVSDDPCFVRPSGLLLDQLDESPLEEEIQVADAAQAVVQVLGRRPAGTSSVLYLTSDAGEGKTTLISQIAREQASLYKQKKADWLLVPVSLGGRTFMRFDDVIIGALMNRLRFQVLFYDAFVELVKLGVVIPALDGFEEMFVEGAAGDAISALGNLMQTLQSSGTVLVAARKAYFEYKGLHTQAKLFDSLGGRSVSFAKLALDRWNKSQFLKYAEKRCVSNGAEIYHEVSTKLMPNHPLLTRAVLVRRLIDVANEVVDRRTLLQRIEGDPEDFFRQFVGSIIAREARDKWIDKKGEAAQPLLTVEEHYELLAAIAHEMWVSQTESLGTEVLEVVADVFAESKKKDKVLTGQIIERVKQHALITKADEHGRKFCFDHVEFYHFFLGASVGQMLAEQDSSSIRHAFRQGVFPNLTMDTAARFVMRMGVAAGQIVETVNKICETEPRSSFVKENLGGLVIRLIDFDTQRTAGVVVRFATFPTNSLMGRRLSNVRFEECYFQPSTLSHSELDLCSFGACEFERIEFSDVTTVRNVVLEDCVCRSVVSRNSDIAVFAPRQINHVLAQMNVRVQNAVREGGEDLVEQDERLEIVERVLRVFMRSSGVNENTFRQRLGAHASDFFDDILPLLRDSDIIAEVPFRGSGRQRRFELRVPLERIRRAVEDCRGNFDSFVRLARDG